MADSLFLLRGSDALSNMKLAAFDTEDIFQHLLAKFPDLLTDTDFGEGSPRRWMLVGREAGVSDHDAGSARWSLDHLFLDQDGVPTLVEVKRASDTRARREVVAQMLDYAANAVRWWRVEKMASWLERTCEQQDTSALERLGRLLATDAPDAESYWRSVQANLTSGRIRLIFVADKIPAELETIIEFLNEQMNPAAVVGLELRPYADGSDRILVPRLIGITARANALKSVSSSMVAESADEWLDGTLSAPANSMSSVRRFVEMVEGLGAGLQVAGQSLAVDYGNGDDACRFAYVRRGGKVAISGYMLAKVPAFQSKSARLELYQRLEDLGFSLSSHSSLGEPTFKLPGIEESLKWTKIQDFIASLIQKINASTP